ncbi:MAG: hypothetical protein IPL55_02270 [Saprospiraceae bacterium]|nr:hypothetical protein [Saprospiraceae bacterium]
MEVNKNKAILDQLDAVEKKVMSALNAVEKAIGNKPFDKKTLDSLKLSDNYELMLGKIWLVNISCTQM